MHTVSKMVLNAWLRGKLPFYSIPPRPLDGVETPSVQHPVPGVEQFLSKIRVDVPYSKSDLEDQEAKIDASPVDSGSNVETSEEKEDVVDWDVVFGNVTGEMENMEEPSNEVINDEESEEESEAEESVENVDDTKHVKPTRMKTNKRKIGTHYYEDANVKNKNRKREKSKMDPKRMEKRLKGDGKRRR